MWRVLLFNKLYAPCREGGGPGFPLTSSTGLLSHLSEVVDLVGCLLLILFASLFGVLVWGEAPIESLIAGEGAAAATGEMERG